MSTVKGMVIITVSHFGCSHESQMDTEQENKLICPLTASTSIYTHTHQALINPSITALCGRTPSTLLQRQLVPVRCYLGPSDLDQAVESASFFISRELAIVALYLVVW